MSTKRIREAISEMCHTIDCDVMRTNACTCRVSDAMDELEAIEDAAAAWWEAESRRGRGMMSHDASATLERIAKERTS